MSTETPSIYHDKDAQGNTLPTPRGKAYHQHLCPLTKEQTLPTIDPNSLTCSSASTNQFSVPSHLPLAAELSYQAPLPVPSVTLFGEIRIKSLIQCSARPNEISFMVSDLR